MARALRRGSDRLFTAATIAPRLVVVAGAMASSFALVAAWSTDTTGQQRLAPIAAIGRVVSVLGAVWLWHVGFELAGPARAWFGVLAAATIVDVGAWLVMTRKATDAALAVATASGTAAMLAAVVVREAPRVALIEPTHGTHDGMILFAVILAMASLQLPGSFES